MAFRSVNSGASTGSASIVVGAPSGVSVNDVVVGAGAWDDSGATITLPANWAPLPQSPKKATGDGLACACGTKFESGTPPADYTFSSSGGSNDCAAVVAAYSGRDREAHIHQSAGNSATASDATPADLSVTSIGTAENCDFIFIGSADWSAEGSPAYTAPTNYTERADVSSTSFTSITLADRENQGATAGGAVTGTSALAGSTSEGFVAFWIALRSQRPATTLNDYSKFPIERLRFTAPQSQRG